MDYGKIVSRSFDIAWRYKWLWLFGMFTAGSFNIDFSFLQDHSIDKSDLFQTFDFQPEVLLSFAFALCLWILIMLICYIISEIGIIDSVNRIERGGSYSFGIAFSSGLTHFLKFLGLNILMFFITIVPIAIIVIIIILLFVVHVALGFLSLLLFLPLLLFVIFVIFNISQLAKRVLIVRSCSIGDALGESYYLLKSNFGKNLVVFLINMGFGIGFSILMAIIYLMIGLPIAAMIVSAELHLLIAFFAAFFIALPISFIFGGFMGVFFSSLYTLFYFELVEPKTDNEQVIQSPPINPNQQPLT